MEIDVIRQFAELMDAFGIKVTRLSMGCPDENDPFDTGLRSLLYEKYDYREGLRRMEEYYEPGMLYLVKNEEVLESVVITGQARCSAVGRR